MTFDIWSGLHSGRELQTSRLNLGIKPPKREEERGKKGGGTCSKDRCPCMFV